MIQSDAVLADDGDHVNVVEGLDEGIEILRKEDGFFRAVRGYIGEDRRMGDRLRYVLQIFVPLFVFEMNIDKRARRAEKKREGDYQDHLRAEKHPLYAFHGASPNLARTPPGARLFRRFCVIRH